jgi:hypothetical protein
MKLEDYRPSTAEEELIIDFPEQVAIGFLRARRRHMQQLRAMMQWPNPFGPA